MLWRQLLHAWLGNLARQKVGEAAGRAVHGAEDQATAADAPPVVFVFALGVESGGLEDRLARSTVTKAQGFTVHRGRLGDRPVLVARSGPGQAKAAHATEALIDAHRPRLVVSAGFGGGLTSELRQNDIVVGTSVCRPDGRELPLGTGFRGGAGDCPDFRGEASENGTVPLCVKGEGVKGDRHLFQAETARKTSQSPTFVTGKILTIDRVARLPTEKRSLGEEHSAMVVDMETYAVAEVCQARGVPCLGVRVIIDAMDDQLPRDVQRLLDQPSEAARWGAALGSILNRPNCTWDLLKLKENSLVATVRLAKFLADVL